jgi:arginyl-tRNA synthetase
MQLTHVLTQLSQSIESLAHREQWAEGFVCEFTPTKDKSHGDYATNAAMVLAKAAKKNPRELASQLQSVIQQLDLPITSVDIAGPGFINVTFDKQSFVSVIPEILASESYGQGSPKDESILVEYVSANPTGTLHIGHARGGAYGDSLSRILSKAGYRVHKEFYVNDGGQQIINLANSILARYQELLGQPFLIPEDGYYGQEIISAANDILRKHGNDLTEADLPLFQELGVSLMLDRLQSDLDRYRVNFDEWFREKTLYPDQIESVLQQLQATGQTYELEGALWLKTSEYGDEKDRVMKTSDGRYTYFVPDTAYHKTKFDRGFDTLINVWGADHHGTIPRLKASLQLLGYPSEKLHIELLQMVKVYQNGEEVKMSKRSGNAIGLLDLIDEVGVDPIRYFFAARALSTPMDLDLDLALRKTNENPVYYAQYAHARIYSLFAKAERLPSPVTTFEHLPQTAHPLLMLLSEYPLVIDEAASKRIPHRLTQYIQSLASAFHQYYNDQPIVTDNEAATNEQLNFIQAIASVLKDALSLIGVSAPERM